MRRLLFAAALLASLPAFGADDPKADPLTPKEIADGTLRLFDGESTFGWTIDGEAAVADGCLILGGTKPTIARTNTHFGDFLVTFDYLGGGKDKGGASTEFQIENPVLRRGVGKEYTSYPAFMYLPTARASWLQASYEVRTVDGKRLEKGDNGVSRVECKGEAVGPFQVAFQVPAGVKLQLRNIRLRPLGLQSVFNGKDLTGWKEHPGKKSKFTVKDGVINLKDGPGDLQTEGQWADFVLQAECFSNGKHLNSGIFFRCLPGQYQQGYESQIHNGWLSEPSKEYTVETFDIETGKLTKSEKVKSAAMDYGTGAIYRRIPARKAVAKDGEWFTMTVAARGRHIATFINGIQVVDWTDTRPVKDNARNGCKLEKGNISIQGHDPTTDLSFRNIRIADLPQGR
jgi:hypothetical protein